MNGWTVAEILAFITMAGYLVKITADYTKLKTNHENLTEVTKQQAENIKELYDSRNKTNETLVQLATILNTLSDQNKTIEKKIDELREKAAK